MLKSEVLILVGKPSEIDTIGSEVNTSNSKEIIVVWQYGNQRVSFRGNKVDGVIADGKKYDKLLISYNRGEFPKKELPERLKKLNDESCK